MQMDEIDNQPRKHLHRNGAPKKDEKVIVGLFAIPICLLHRSDPSTGATGQRPRRQLADCKL
uniref:Uncharacterized protein n=1 Tax=Romanomermis culicivorax TaxID=13658 RepID=A0A915KEE5_ROMCU